MWSVDRGYVQRQVSPLSPQFLSISGTDRKKASWALSGVSNFSGSVATRPPLGGSRACFRRSRLHKLIVRITWQLSLGRYRLTISLLANFLRINVYLTQKIGEDMLWNIAVNDAGAEYDPLTLLRSRTMFGRPDWKSIFSTLRQSIESGQYLPGSTSQLKTKVAVSHLQYIRDTYLLTLPKTYFCGPGVIAKALKEACVENTNSSVEFSFAKVRAHICPRVILRLTGSFVGTFLVSLRLYCMPASLVATDVIIYYPHTSLPCIHVWYR